METSHSQCQDLKARYEEASSETKAKHEEALQKLQTLLRGTEERLAATQEQNKDLLQEVVELKKQAEDARVSGRGNYVAFVCLGSASGWKGP